LVAIIAIQRNGLKDFPMQVSKHAMMTPENVFSSKKTLSLPSRHGFFQGQKH
jgi:hypothetical protein